MEHAKVHLGTFSDQAGSTKSTENLPKVAGVLLSGLARDEDVVDVDEYKVQPVE